MIDPAIADLRREYNQGGLLEREAAADPIQQFRRWLDDAKAADQIEPNAMTLATVDAQGYPAARMVLLKSVDSQGFVFFTNYDSDKGLQLASTPAAALVFWWDRIERQVRVEGRVEKVSTAESDEYFASRPRNSQLGAIVSPQSRPGIWRTCF